MAGNPTIRDVALAANVAIGTVSRVLNGHKSVSDGVRRELPQLLRRHAEQPVVGNAVAFGAVIHHIENHLVPVC